MTKQKRGGQNLLRDITFVYPGLHGTSLRFSMSDPKKFVLGSHLLVEGIGL
jgi:hypothetical protein